MKRIALLVLLAAACKTTDSSPPTPGASFSGPGHDSRERSISVHVIAPGICVAVYREAPRDDTLAVAMTSIPCPSNEAPQPTQEPTP